MVRVVIAACAFAVAVTAAATAGIEHTMLHGASVRSVRVAIDHDEIPELTEEDIQSLIESRLHKAGIEMTEGAAGTLWVIALVVRGESPVCVVDLDARLMEDARLERNGHMVPARSWGSGGLVVGASPEECTQGVVGVAERFADDFIEMYSAMNPES